MPDERTRALLAAGEFLAELLNPLKTPGVPEVIREYALYVLRHYPARIDVEIIAHNDSRGALMGPMLDASCARDWKKTT
ncbi:BPSL0761 family protein [Duganella sp. LjRoot269]|uniref:BPSL0761 family protein n=1 Tax=Duganella sp. LjRoot269 TaxID=3342305 RepID=UPI003ED0EE90